MMVLQWMFDKWKWTAPFWLIVLIYAYITLIQLVCGVIPSHSTRDSRVFAEVSIGRIMVMISNFCFPWNISGVVLMPVLWMDSVVSQNQGPTNHSIVGIANNKPSFFFGGGVQYFEKPPFGRDKKL